MPSGIDAFELVLGGEFENLHQGNSLGAAPYVVVQQFVEPVRVERDLQRGGPLGGCLGGSAEKRQQGGGLQEVPAGGCILHADVLFSVMRPRGYGRSGRAPACSSARASPPLVSSRMGAAGRMPWPTGRCPGCALTAACPLPRQ